jgi:hypothetical protein
VSDQGPADVRTLACRVRGEEEVQLLASNIAQRSLEAIYWRGALVQPSCTRPLKGRKSSGQCAGLY